MQGKCDLFRRNIVRPEIFEIIDYVDGLAVGRLQAGRQLKSWKTDLRYEFITYFNQNEFSKTNRQKFKDILKFYPS